MEMQCDYVNESIHTHRNEHIISLLAMINVMRGIIVNLAIIYTKKVKNYNQTIITP